jgi:MFS transporter, ACS family, hexuronate transporter
LSTEEAAYIAAGQEPTLQADDDEKPSLREIIKERNFWCIALPRFFADPVGLIQLSLH